INPNEKVLCRGSYWRPPYIRCWSVHGNVDFYSALAGSCNVYFQEAAHRAGIDKMVEVAQAFGMGEKTNTLGIINESSGLLPTPKWKKELYEASLGKKYEKKFNDLNKERMDKLSTASEEEKDKINRQYDSKKKTLEAQQKIDLNFYTRWQPFDTYNISIGQGSNSFTLVQLANLTATIANGGRHYQPYLIDRIVSPDGQIVQKYTPKMLNKVPVSGVNLAHVKEGMRRVSEPGGTAYFLFHDIPAEVGAKTGTAQTNRVGDNKRKEFHGVFLAFTPVENPQIAFAGLVEYGQSGSGSAGHVAKAVFEEYYGLNKEEEPEND
ncbi:MAG: penicillin-binding protein 2, partial [Clostridia bacterium]|nr:penicillin-binding protein 2 [Clostridia bacterium]